MADDKIQEKKELSTMDVMLQIMLKREMRLVAEEEAKVEAAKKREEQRDRNARSNFEDVLTKQAACRHLKGGKHRSRTQAKDYAVYIHTFINTERVIRCFLCGMKWKNQDTKEFLVRNGIKKANHTRIGWDGALDMLAETSNQPSASEVPMTVTPTANLVEV